ncbi:MAG: response regulator [Phycisphaeraceae bacterium]|nr:MAG: response regulator [Phycisphaeraceae bacterium]
MTTKTTSKVLLIGGRRLDDDALAVLLGDSYAEAAPGGRAEALEGLLHVLLRGGLDAELVDADSEGARPAAPDEDQGRLLFEAIGEGVCLADRQGRVLWSNGFFRRIDEASRAEIGVCLCEARDWFDQHHASVARRVAQREVCRFEVEATGSEEIYELEITPARVSHAEGQGEQIERLAVVVRDITASRRSARKLDAIDKAGVELVRLDAAAVRERNTYQRLQLMEEKIVRVMHDVLNYDHFAIFLIDEPRKRLELVISAGLPPEIHDLDLSPEKEGSGISGYVAATGRSYVCRDASSDERFLPGLHGARSSCTVPLRMHDRIIGIMDVESKQAEAFDDEEKQFLEIFGRYIAIALHMLDLLVVERSATNLTASDRMGGELEEPLADIVKELDLLGESSLDPETASHLGRIREDVEAIRGRVANVAAGPQTLLGVDRALEVRGLDPVLSGKRVLVADDEPKICKVIQAVLKARGCDADVVTCGRDAIGLLEGIAAGGQDYDIVITDIRMPDHNGYEVFSAVRKHCARAPVILMTGFGYDPHHSIVRASQEGMSSVLFKPFDIEQLIDAMHKALAEKG